MLEQYVLGKPILAYIIRRVSDDKWEVIYSRDVKGLTKWSNHLAINPINWSPFVLTDLTQSVNFIEKNEPTAIQTGWKLWELQESEIFVEVL